MLPAAATIITLALVFYSIGVWAERIRRTLKPWHAAMFGVGLACDATGTFLMTRIAASSSAAPSSFAVGLMGVTGTIALALMAVHFVWAIVVLVRNRENEKHAFHRFSIVVWAIWLVPYIAGAVAGMS